MGCMSCATCNVIRNTRPSSVAHFTASGSALTARGECTFINRDRSFIHYISFQMPFRSLVARSVDPQPTSCRLSCAFATTAAESHENDEHVDRLGPWDIIGRLDLTNDDSRAESEWKWKLLCWSAEPNWRLHIRIQSLKQSHSRHGTHFDTAPSSVREATAIHRSPDAAEEARNCDEANVDSGRASLTGVQSNQLSYRCDEHFVNLKLPQPIKVLPRFPRDILRTIVFQIW